MPGAGPLGRWCAAWALLALGVGVEPAFGAPGGSGAPADEPHDTAAGPPEPVWEGAIGLIVRQGAAYPGSALRHTGIRPGGFLRWGPYTVTGAGGFTTRRNMPENGTVTARRGGSARTKEPVNNPVGG